MTPADPCRTSTSPPPTRTWSDNSPSSTKCALKSGGPKDERYNLVQSGLVLSDLVHSGLVFSGGGSRCVMSVMKVLVCSTVDTRVSSRFVYMAARECIRPSRRPLQDFSCHHQIIRLLSWTGLTSSTCDIKHPPWALYTCSTQA